MVTTTDLLVADAMSANPICVGLDDSLASVAEILDKHRIRHVLVVEPDQTLVGLVSHRDLVREGLFASSELPYSEFQRLLRTSEVRGAYTSHPDTVNEDTTLLEAGRLMLENKYGCLPVVRGQTVVGILTESDFIKHYIRSSESN